MGFICDIKKDFLIFKKKEKKISRRFSGIGFYPNYLYFLDILLKFKDTKRN